MTAADGAGAWRSPRLPDPTRQRRRRGSVASPARAKRLASPVTCRSLGRLLGRRRRGWCDLRDLPAALQRIGDEARRLHLLDVFRQIGGAGLAALAALL